MDSVLDSSAAHKAGDYANGQVNNFLDSVEDLTKALKDIETPEIARVRAKVKLALMAAARALAAGPGFGPGGGRPAGPVLPGRPRRGRAATGPPRPGPHNPPARG